VAPNVGLQLVIFDCDGVLVDHLPAEAIVLAQRCCSARVGPPELRQYAQSSAVMVSVEVALIEGRSLDLVVDGTWVEAVEQRAFGPGRSGL
jgi:beta-phosphoglucomutase-like phosphatase (HAD superfamily)